MNPTQVIAGAVIGYDSRNIIVADKVYVLKPPTIHRIAGACYWLADIPEGDSIKAMLGAMSRYDALAKALSFFINGDESLAEEFMQAPADEVIDGLEQAFSLIDTANFLKLSVLRRSAVTLAAKPNT